MIRSPGAAGVVALALVAASVVGACSRDVAIDDWLARAEPCCPIVVHTTNRPAADGMDLALTDAGWQLERIMPYESCRWIAEAWLPLVRRLIVQSAVVESGTVASTR